MPPIKDRSRVNASILYRILSSRLGVSASTSSIAIQHKRLGVYVAL
jgi:hypothetical protein